MKKKKIKELKGTTDFFKRLSSKMLTTNYLSTAKTATAKIYHAQKQKCLFIAMI